MSHRYRLTPTVEQAQFMLMRHCADARLVWNVAVEQFNWGRASRPAPGSAQRQRQLAEARADNEWLAAGSSSVQQQALRDFDKAVAGFFQGVYRRPRWRRKHRDEGFCVRDTKVVVVNKKWARVFIPKLGFVDFRLSRPLPQRKLGMARVTLKAGRWHVAFPAPQPPVPGKPGRENQMVGIDRGVHTTVALSSGGMLRAPVMREREQKRLTRLQQQLSRCQKGSIRRGKIKARIARLHAHVRDRRVDWVEKTTTRIAATYSFIGVENLHIRNMVKAPKPKLDPDNPGVFLPNGRASSAGLSRGIYANCWGLIAQRLEAKTQASGTQLVRVPAHYTSQECRACGHIAKENRQSQAEFLCVKCGHKAHADINAAHNILARALKLAHTPGPGATPNTTGVLAKARTTKTAHAA